MYLSSQLQVRDRAIQVGLGPVDPLGRSHVGRVTAQGLAKHGLGPDDQVQVLMLAHRAIRERQILLVNQLDLVGIGLHLGIDRALDQGDFQSGRTCSPAIRAYP